jgi:hypothetical protein
MKRNDRGKHHHPDQLSHAPDFPMAVKSSANNGKKGCIGFKENADQKGSRERNGSNRGKSPRPA